MKTYQKIAAKDGRLLWKLQKTGPRGGVQVLYTERMADEDAPSPWRIWAQSQREAIGTAMVGHGI